MKVLSIVTGELCFDGITNSILNYYRAMDRTDMSIGIVSARKTDKDMKVNFEELGCKVYCIENRDRHTLKYIWMLIQIIWSEKYDIVHAHGNSATLAFEMVAARIAGCKVRIAHSRNSFCEHRTMDKILRPLLYVNYTDGFACGQMAGEWLFGKRPFTIIQNGKDIKRFLFNEDVRKEYRKLLNVDNNTVLLGHVGLFHQQKNHAFLINIFEEVCKRASKYKLILIGDGDEKSRIQELVQKKRLSEKVVFLGRQSNVQEWLQALDIMIFPSLFEGMPNVVLEWQIAGLPAIISDVITRECAITDLVEFMSLTSGSEQWAEKILNISICDRKKGNEYIRNAFENAGFDIEKNAIALKERYRQLLEKR